MRSKALWKPGTLLYPLPAVMVSVGARREEYNIITVAWAGTICSDPPMCSISIRPERHSYGIISAHKAFVINLTTRALAFAADWCGVKSGRDVDKFKEMKLTPRTASAVTAPIIEESPVNIECTVTDMMKLGTHHMFIAKVAAVQVDSACINPKTGVFRFHDTAPICFSHGRYYEVGKLIGQFGFSVRKKGKTERRRKG
ncbi:MAG: flavin reductase family protein [Spirochaetota bacterium]